MGQDITLQSREVLFNLDLGETETSIPWDNLVRNDALQTLGIS